MYCIEEEYYYCIKMYVYYWNLYWEAIDSSRCIIQQHILREFDSWIV